MEFNAMHYNFSNPELDENILESTEMSPNNSNFVFSPSAKSIKSEGWNTTNNHNYLFNQQSSWQWSSLEHESGNQTPMQSINYPQDNHAQSQAFFNPQYTPAQTINDSMPNSPEGDSTPTEHREQRPTHSRASPVLASHATLMRRDGMRKKNVKIPIPTERTLNNIDTLISKSTDESEIKELKSQKRLLRNRQAALDSRQRKKQHTDRLEQDKKTLLSQMDQMEEERAALLREVDMLTQHNKQITTDMQKAEFHKEQLLQENLRLQEENQVCKDMIQQATNKEGQQNKIIRELTDEIHRRGTVDSEPTFDEESYVDMGAIEGFPSDPVVKPDVDAIEPAKPAAQGLLLMLLLFGAFVASKGGSSTAIPPVSDDMRDASATILNDIFSEAGVSSSMTAFAPSASAPANINSWNGLSTTHVNMAQITRSGFPQLGLSDFEHLSQPSLEQQREQLFGMSAEQFNEVTNYDFLQDAPPVLSSSSGRRNLAESLAAMRAEKGKKTEVYTRSLLWNQVPQDVVRRFAQMVEGYDSGINPKTLG